MTQRRQGIANDLLQVGRGILMGGADVIPGVSGGTVALIVGIYERLITAISHIDIQLLRMLRRGELRAAAEHLDLRFLIALGLGIASGIVALGSIMEKLLTGPQTRGYTLAAFFGMILGSTWIVYQMLDVRTSRRRWEAVLMALLGGAFAYWLTGLSVLGASITPGYVFLCGVIGICAMILPGISGAYLLLILGFYPTLTDILHRLKDGDINFNDVKTVALFGLGCALGITGFSKILRWLLGNYHSPTLAVLCGFMIGALRRIWPFQLDLTPHTESLKLKHYENTWPTQWGAYEFQCVGVLLMGFAAVVILEWISVRRHQSPTPAA